MFIVAPEGVAEVIAEANSTDPHVEAFCRLGGATTALKSP